MRNFRSRLDNLESVLMAEPAPGEIDRVRRRVSAGLELTHDDEWAIRKAGSIVVETDAGAVIVSCGAGGVVGKRLVGVQAGWI